MGITNFVKRISDATEEIKEAITRKGVVVSECDSLEDIPDRIDEINTQSEGRTSVYTFLVFTSSKSTPSAPTGGGLSDELVFTYPSNWGDGSGLTSDIWVSYADFTINGIVGNWHTPVKMSGSSSSGSVDLSNYALKSWVLEQIKESIKPGGIIDLSNYATKEYVDSKITESTEGVASINGLTGAINLINGTDNVTIEEEGKNIKISVNASSVDGDTFKEFILYTASASDSIAPAVPDADTTWDESTDELVNPPTGWKKSVVVTVGSKYVWQITGVFSKKTRKISGSWYGPICLTGSAGPKGEDGDEIEEVYCLSNEAITPTINSTEADSSNKNKADDGYLPKFVFTNESKEAVSERPSVSSSNRYLFGTKRRKHNGTWLDFSTSYLLANFVEAGLTDEEKEQIKTDVTKDISNEINQAEARVSAVESRVDSIDFTKSTFVNDPDNALISAITQYKNKSQKSFADLIVDGKKAEIKTWAGQVVDEKSPTGDQLITKITDAGIDLNGAQGVVDEWATYKTKTDGNETELNSVHSTLNAQKARIEEVAQNTYTDEQLQSKITNYAGTKIDAKAAEINSTVAKSKWIWGVYDNSDSPTEVLATKEYDITQFTNTVDSSGNVVTAPMTEDAYRKTIEGTEWEEDTQAPKRKWTRIVQTDAFSKIIQKTNSIIFAVNEGESWASIVAKANESTGSELCLDADRINLNGTTNATTAVIGNAQITNATITEGTITKAKINSCTIASEIKSKTYCNGTDPETGENKPKKGFLFDAGGEEFAIYGGSDEDSTKFELTSSGLVIPTATITKLLNAGEITASKLKVNAANITGEISVNKIQSDNFDDMEGTGFSLDATNNSFCLYGKDSENNVTEISNERVILPAACVSGKLTSATIDASKIVSGYIDAERIASNSISAKKLDVSDLVVKKLRTSESGEKIETVGNKMIISNARSKIVSEINPSKGLEVDSSIELTKSWKRSRDATILILSGSTAPTTGVLTTTTITDLSYTTEFTASPYDVHTYVKNLAFYVSGESSDAENITGLIVNITVYAEESAAKTKFILATKRLAFTDLSLCSGTYYPDTIRSMPATSNTAYSFKIDTRYSLSTSTGKSVSLDFKIKTLSNLEVGFITNRGVLIGNNGISIGAIPINKYININAYGERMLEIEGNTCGISVGDDILVKVKNGEYSSLNNPVVLRRTMTRSTVSESADFINRLMDLSQDGTPIYIDAFVSAALPIVRVLLGSIDNNSWYGTAIISKDGDDYSVCVGFNGTMAAGRFASNPSFFGSYSKVLGNLEQDLTNANSTINSQQELIKKLETRLTVLEEKVEGLLSSD